MSSDEKNVGYNVFSRVIIRKFKKNEKEKDTKKQKSKPIQEHVHCAIVILVDIVGEFNGNTCTLSSLLWPRTAYHKKVRFKIGEKRSEDMSEQLEVGSFL